MWHYLLVGILLGFIIAIYIWYKNTGIYRYNWKIAFEISEKLLDSLKKDDINVVIETFNQLKNSNMKCVLKKSKYKSISNEQNIWLALVFYMAHKYASYEYDEKVFHTLIGLCYGTDSIAYKKFCAIDTIINYSPAYYSDYGLPRSQMEQHDGYFFQDYADNLFYEYIYNLTTNGNI